MTDSSYVNRRIINTYNKINARLYTFSNKMESQHIKIFLIRIKTLNFRAEKGYLEKRVRSFFKIKKRKEKYITKKVNIRVHCIILTIRSYLKICQRIC